jgi:hypothetical protein
MTVYSSSDVSAEILLDFVREAGSDLKIEIAEEKFYRKSPEAESLIALLGHLHWWHVLGGAAVTTATKYAHTLAESAAKDTWGARKEIVADTREKIRKLGSAVAKLIRRSKPGTQVAIGVPFPNDWFSTRLQLQEFDENSATLQIQIFLNNLKALEELINELAETPPATGIFLRIVDSSAMEAYWFDGKTLQRFTRRLAELSTESGHVQ